MPKRIGNLYEKVISEENCIAAVREMLKGKRRACLYARLHTKTKGETGITLQTRQMKARRKRDRIQHIRNDIEGFGRKVTQDLREGTWIPKPYRERKIYDGIRGKLRTIRVPCLYDQIVHHAIMRVTAPEIMRRNYYYNCGSIPKAGQARATEALKKWLGGRKPPKYAMVLDVAKFYDNCPHETVMNEFRRIFKDSRFLSLHEKILSSMGPGLAIGFYPSQWYANAVLSKLDREIKQRILPDCKMVRYMDDIVILHSNKRKLHRARILIVSVLRQLGLTVKSNWQVFRIKERGISFLSYRFFHGYTILRKQLMHRISRRMRSAAKRLTPHAAMAVVSYYGIIQRCNSYHFRQMHVYPYINIDKCKGVIRYVAKLCRVFECSATIRSTSAS